MSEAEDHWCVAVEAVYAAFSPYERPVRMHAAPKHDVPDVLKRLQSASLRQLSPDSLGAFAGSVLYTIGDLSDYKHFLPRILELMVTEQPWIGLAPEAIAGKLVYADWTAWPQNERAAIQALFAAGWTWLRYEGPDVGNAAAFLCANARLGIDIAPLLKGWLPAPRGVVQLARLVVISTSDLAEYPFWNETPALARERLKAWGQGADVLMALVEGQDQVTPEDQWDVELALQALKGDATLQ